MNLIYIYISITVWDTTWVLFCWFSLLTLDMASCILDWPWTQSGPRILLLPPIKCWVWGYCNNFLYLLFCHETVWTFTLVPAAGNRLTFSEKESYFLRDQLKQTNTKQNNKNKQTNKRFTKFFQLLRKCIGLLYLSEYYINFRSKTRCLRTKCAHPLFLSLFPK